MCQNLQLSLDDLDGLLMALPVVDTLRVETGSFVVGFLPHDLVSADEKLMVVIASGSPEGRRIADSLRELALVLGLARPINVILHGGGAAFTFRDQADQAVSLADPRFPAQRTLAALGLLRDIAGASQIAFLRDQRAAA